MNTEEIPYIDEALLLALSARFPASVPTNECPIFYYGKLAGHKEIIEFLRAVKKKQDSKKALPQVLTDL